MPADSRRYLQAGEVTSANRHGRVRTGVLFQTFFGFWFMVIKVSCLFINLF